MFSVVLADPAWRFGDKIGKRGADAHYQTMATEEIAALEVPACDDAVAVVWTPSSMLIDGLTVMSAWGFRQTQTYIWAKVTKDGRIRLGMGRLFRQCHEVALVGVRGRYAPANRSQPSVLYAPRGKHSAKPEGLHASLELMYPDGLWLELFARRRRPGWVCLGNELSGRDIRDDLADYSW